MFHAGHAVWMMIPCDIFQVFSPTTPSDHLAVGIDATVVLGEHCNVGRLKDKDNDLAFSNLFWFPSLEFSGLLFRNAP